VTGWTSSSVIFRGSAYPSFVLTLIADAEIRLPTQFHFHPSFSIQPNTPEHICRNCGYGKTVQTNQRILVSIFYTGKI
jgi:hypothetical protein